MEAARSESVNVVIGRSPGGEVLSSFKSAGGRTVRVLDREVYRKASEAADKTLREIIRGEKKK
jgi:hypothetical protein